LDRRELSGGRLSGSQLFLRHRLSHRRSGLRALQLRLRNCLGRVRLRHGLGNEVCGVRDRRQHGQRGHGVHTVHQRLLQYGRDDSHHLAHEVLHHLDDLRSDDAV
jgi:hypothetical protein